MSHFNLTLYENLKNQELQDRNAFLRMGVLFKVMIKNVRYKDLKL